MALHGRYPCKRTLGVLRLSEDVDADGAKNIAHKNGHSHPAGCSNRGGPGAVQGRHALIDRPISLHEAMPQHFRQRGVVQRTEPPRSGIPRDLNRIGRRGWAKAPIERAGRRQVPYPYPGRLGAE